MSNVELDLQFIRTGDGGDTQVRLWEVQMILYFGMHVSVLSLSNNYGYLPDGRSEDTPGTNFYSVYFWKFIIILGPQNISITGGTFWTNNGEFSFNCFFDSYPALVSFL